MSDTSVADGKPGDTTTTTTTDTTTTASRPMGTDGTTTSQTSKTTTGDDSTVDTTTPKARADGKPGWLPEKFKSEEDLAKSYRELEHKQFTRRDEIKAEIATELKEAAEKGMPKAPVDYTFEPIKTKEGAELKLNPEDPLTKWFQNVAWEMKIPQARFQALVADYIKVDSTRGPDWKVEAAALGPEADRRLDRVGGWARGNLPQELYDTFSRIPATAQMVKMFEHVMTLTGQPAFIPDDSGAGFKENLTRADLEAMMKDERYWKGKDKQYIAQVRAGFRKIAN